MAARTPTGRRGAPRPARRPVPARPTPPRAPGASRRRLPGPPRRGAAPRRSAMVSPAVAPPARAVQVPSVPAEQPLRAPEHDEEVEAEDADVLERGRPEP